jgi:AcrR family transcriptional regulator
MDHETAAMTDATTNRRDPPVGTPTPGQPPVEADLDPLTDVVMRDRDTDADDRDDARDGDGVSVEPDGRRRRRERNREAVVDALLDLYREGNLRPGTDEIAERAGLSPRSVFRYFDDVDDLAGVAVLRQLVRARPLIPIAAGPDDPFETRVQALVDQRFRLFAAVGHAATVSRIRAPFQPTLADGLHRNRAYLRHQIRTLFAQELTGSDADQVAATLAAVDLLTTFEAYQILQEDHGFAADEAKAVTIRAVTVLLADRVAAGPDGGGPETDTAQAPVTQDGE